MEGLGNFLDCYPSMFLKDHFVKYLGWMLYDKSSLVRKAAASVLLTLYDKEENLSKLENFTARFLKRLQDLIHDVDPHVKLYAVEILRKLLGAGYLDETPQELLDEVDEILLDPTHDIKLREQSMLFFTAHVDNFDGSAQRSRDQEDEDEGEDADDGDARKKGDRGQQAKKKGRRSSTASGSKREGVTDRMVTVVHFLDYHLGDLPLEDCDQLFATCVESFGKHPEGDFLYDWLTYFDLLREHKRASSRLNDHEQSILTRVLAASVKRVASACNAGKEKSFGKVVNKTREAFEVALEAFTSSAVEELPKIISQFQVMCDEAPTLGSVWSNTCLYVSFPLMTTDGPIQDVRSCYSSSIPST